MALEELRRRVWRANRRLAEVGLAVLTWGNASGADRQAGLMAIKPSGVSYEELEPSDIVLVSLVDGSVVEGDLRPSSDTPTHLALYEAFSSVGGIVHTHSPYATAWAQACREIPCLGTTHADHFYGPVPLTRQLTPDEVRQDYERNTGRVIVERFCAEGLDPSEVPAVLVPGHGPLAWGRDVEAALENAIVLEETARMALWARFIAPEAGGIPPFLLDKHFLRKHGPGAYYGQRDEKAPR